MLWCRRSQKRGQLVEAWTLARAEAEVARVRQSGREAELIEFPTRNTAVGALMRDYIERAPERDAIVERAWDMLMSANRWDENERMRDLLDGGVTVVVVGYVDANRTSLAAAGLLKPDVVLPKE